MTFRNTVNLSNSIIGVSLLAMPFCFKKCGVLLSIVLVIASGLVNRLGCHLLLRSAMLSKRRNFELLAYQTYGTVGKLLVEFGVLGFLLGSCVAFFVVIGDLGPSVVSELFSIPNGPHLRAFILTFLGMFVALPLGLLRRVDSLTSFSALSLGLYVFLILKLFTEASSHMSSSQNAFVESVNLWDTSALFTSLPIFAMALSCQPQLFEIFDGTQILSEDYTSINKLNRVIKDAINVCSVVYIAVGMFGYMAFFDQPFRGNILVFLSPSFTSVLTKVGFIFTVIISLPLCLFPCRTSLHSLLFGKGTGSLLNDMSNTPIYMSDRHFTLLTIVLIVSTIGISVLLPHIEIVLGIIGSTIGAVICFIIPAAIFLNLRVNNTVERFMAKALFYLGIFILIACSYCTLRDARVITDTTSIIDSIKSNSDFKISADKHFNAPVFHKVPVATKAVSQKPVITIKPIEDIEETRRREKLAEMDAIKEKKQEELLRRLEKQQEEHKKLLDQQKQILQEIKRHDEAHHKTLQSPKPVVNSPNVVSEQSRKEQLKIETIPKQKEKSSKLLPKNSERVAAEKPMAKPAVSIGNNRKLNVVNQSSVQKENYKPLATVLSKKGTLEKNILDDKGKFNGSELIQKLNAEKKDVNVVVDAGPKRDVLSVNIANKTLKT